MAEKSHEITAVPLLLQNISVAEKLITGDAMQAQRGLSRQIVKGGGDYLWTVKKNLKGLYQELEQGCAGETQRPAELEIFEHYDKGQGRIEYRRLTASAELANQVDWPFAGQVFQLYRERTVCNSGKTTQETVYGITSLPPLEADAAALLRIARGHWRIENGLHYRRDVTFKEDACRTKSAATAEGLAVFNNLALGLLRRGWENIAKARRYCESHLDHALSLIQTAPC